MELDEGAARFDFTELTGRYSACLVALALPRGVVEAALPPGLGLCDQPLTGASTHPVLFGFGRHADVRLTRRLARFPGFPLDYLEALSMIPFVRRRGLAEGPFLHLHRLFLDGLMAVTGGVALWGFPKQMARLEEGPGRFEVASYRRGPVASLRFEVGESTTGDLDAFAPVRLILRQPLIQGAFGRLGLHVGSTMDWGVDRAEVRPARATARIYNRFLPGVEGTGERMGAFHVRTGWRLSLPYPRV